MAAFGARREDLQHAQQLCAAGAFEVYPENWTALQLFLRLATQWRLVGLSTMVGARLIQTGLDYGVVEPTMRLMGIKSRHRAALFDKLQAMEQAVLDVVLAS